MEYYISPKLEFIIKLACVLIIFGLAIAVVINGKKLSCYECEITFTSFQREPGSASNKVKQVMKININDIYDNLQEDYCFLEFSEMDGFIRKDVIKIE